MYVTLSYCSVESFKKNKYFVFSYIIQSSYVLSYYIKIYNYPCQKKKKSFLSKPS